MCYKNKNIVNNIFKRICNLIMFTPQKPSSSPNKLPVVVVLGSTATGKSKLAIDLALKYGGEVISADSMQVYKGLDILTNKATPNEMKGVPHHMIGVVDRTEKFDVVHFRDQALPMLESIMQAGKIPFIVGGTNYYIESLLWEILIAKKGKGPDDDSSSKRKHETDDDSEETENIDNETLEKNPIIHQFHSNSGRVEEDDIKSWNNLQLHSALQLVDIERANRLHPNDRRKVIRSLQVRFQTGTKHSKLIAQQCSPLENDYNDARARETSAFPLNNRTLLGGPLRFPQAICLWIQADKYVLQKRIEERVDNMTSLGLKQELNSYIDILKAENSNLNYEEGILQSIGFKEFHPYLQLDPSLRESSEGIKRFQDGILRLKIVTRQYARKQTKWINQRFILPHRREVPPVFTLNGNLVDQENWNNNVYSPAVDIINAYLENELDDNPSIQERLVVGKEEIDEDVVARVCTVCENRVFIGKLQWNSHLNSIRHKKVLKKKANANNAVSEQMVHESSSDNSTSPSAVT